MVKYTGMGEANLGEESSGDLGDCSVNKWSLVIVNLVLMGAGLILIVVAAAAKASLIINTVPILGGVIAMGVFVLFLSWMGLFASIGYPVTKRPITLFIYTMLLILLFIIHFSVSVAALVVDRDQQRQVMETAWCNLHKNDQINIQKHFHCKSFGGNVTDPELCNKAVGFDDAPQGYLSEYPDCYEYLEDDVEYAVKLAGGISLGFCFIELVGIILSIVYRSKSHLHWAKEKGYTKEIL